MQILAGLFDHMVLQRNPQNVSAAPLSGSTPVTGPVVAKVRRGNRCVPGFAAKTIGRAVRGAFSARLDDLPVGGPYTVTLTITSPDKKTFDTLTVRDVLVGEVWIAAGQSNMEGCGRIQQAAPPHDLVRAFYMDDHWDVARDPVHSLAVSIDPVHADLAGGTRPTRSPHIGAGPAVAFARELHRVTGIPQGILACAHGGTNMAHWDPKLKSAGGKSLYGATLRRVAKNGGRVAGVIWYQGESEADPRNAAVYTARMKNLVAAFRRDLKNPRLPFALVQLARVIAPWPNLGAWNSVQEQQRLLPLLIRDCTVVPAIDLALDDLIHINGRDQQRLGRRLGEAVLALRGHQRSLPPPITLKRISAQQDPVSSNANLILEFDHVVGKLDAAGRPLGFTLADVDGPNCLYAVDLDGSRAILHASVPLSDLETKGLSYGRGLDPACNVTDSADRSLPVFGPLPATKLRALTPFARTMEVAAFQPSSGKLATLKYPVNPEALQFAQRTFSANFCSLHPELAALTPQDVTVFYRLPLDCPTPMKLAVLLGYDGPVKMWVDGREKFHDPDGINPAVIDARSIPVSVSAGKHEIMVALGSNRGQAWGVFLRLERKDVSPRLLKQGPTQYALPVLPG